MVRLLVFIASFISLGTGLMADEEPGRKSFADAVVAISCDELHWVRISHALGFGSSLGVPREKLLAQVPESKVSKLDSQVLEALLVGSDSIPLWVGCLKDDRLTGIHENDRFNGASSEQSRRITCREAAATVLSVTIPSQVIANASGDDPNERLIAAAEAWRTRTTGLSPDDRLRAWFEAATDERDSFFLHGFTYQVGHSAAYPVLEKKFLKQASKPDAMLFLNVSAYFRHRRAGADSFRQKLLETLPKDYRLEGPEDSKQFFFSMWENLTRYATMDDAIDAWRDSKLDTRELQELVMRTVDMPWAYHSRAVEPVELHVPVMEVNIVSLVRAAHAQQEARSRSELLRIGVEAAGWLNQIRQHAHFLDPPDSRPHAMDWRKTADQLTQMLDDQREVKWTSRHVSTPAEEAVRLTWRLWGPGTVFAPKLSDGNRDWRIDVPLLVRSQPGIGLVPFARQLLESGNYLPAEAYPQDEARKIFETVYQGTAADMRKALETLPWRSRLLALTEQRYSKSEKLLSQMPVFVERVDKGDPAPDFDAVWEKIKGQFIDADSWNLMRNWLASESRQGRRWRIRGQSSINRPGFTVIVAPSDCDPSRAIPELQASISLYSQPERFRILPHGLERVPRDSWPEIRKMASERSEFRDFLKDAPFPGDSFSELKGYQARIAMLDGEIDFEMGVGIESLVWMGPER